MVADATGRDARRAGCGSDQELGAERHVSSGTRERVVDVNGFRNP